MTSMYIVEKEFKIPYGHRLSCHKGDCKNFHGHNATIRVAIYGKKLNENNMIMDFSELKGIVNRIINEWDHALLLNVDDPMKHNMPGMKVEYFNGDPTSEKMSEVLFKEVQKILDQEYTRELKVLYVKFYETDSACSIYTESNLGV